MRVVVEEDATDPGDAVLLAEHAGRLGATAELVPSSEAFDHFALVWVVDGGELLVQPATTGREQPVTCWKNTVFDKQPAHVLDCPRLG